MSIWKGQINSEFVFSPGQKFRATMRWNMKFGRVDVVIWTYKAQGSKPSFWKDVKTTGVSLRMCAIIITAKEHKTDRFFPPAMKVQAL